MEEKKRLEFVAARKLVGDQILDNEDTALGYEANVAMLLSDHYNRANFKDPKTRNEAAKDILKLIFRGQHN